MGSGISIHAPARGATVDVDYLTFNLNISIHAPARGATDELAKSVYCFLISIHAPARGATKQQKAGCVCLQFQSTLPRGERPQFSLSQKVKEYFNPRSREGSDWYEIPAQTLSTQFQSTLPRGERRSCVVSPSGFWNFNPRSREGSDDMHAALDYELEHFNPRSREGSDTRQPKNGLLILISIHAPARGATSTEAFRNPLRVLFQSTLPRGERLKQIEKELLAMVISIHAPARGATVIVSPFNPTCKFQSTLPRGERLNIQIIHIPYAEFQSTLPRGERPCFWHFDSGM